MGFLSRQKCANNGGGGGGASITINTTAPLQGGDVGTTFDLSWSFDNEAQGDLVVRGPSEWLRQAIGTNGQYLVVSGGMPTWGAAPASAVTIQTSGILTGGSGTPGNSFTIGIDESNLVHRSGAETITGVKNFDADVRIATTRVIRGTRELVLWAEDSTSIGSRLQLAVGTSPTVVVAYLSRYSFSLGTTGLIGNTVAPGLLLPKTNDVDYGIAFESDDGSAIIDGVSKRFVQNPFTGVDEDLLRVGQAESGLQNLKLAGVNYVEIRVNENSEGGAYLKNGGLWQWDKCALEFSHLIISPPNPVDLGTIDPTFFIGCDTSSALGDISLPDLDILDVLVGRAYLLYDYARNAGTNNVTLKAQGTGVTIDGGASVTIDADGGALLVVLSTATEWTVTRLGAAPATPYTLPIYLVGPPNSGPGGSSPPYATLAAAKAAAPAAPTRSLFILMPAADNYYTGGFVVDTKPISVVSWVRHNGSTAGEGPVVVNGGLVVSPASAGWRLQFAGIKWVNTAGKGIEISGSNTGEVDFSDCDAEGSDEGCHVTASAVWVVKALRGRFVGTAKSAFEADSAAHQCFLESTYCLTPTGSGINGVKAENGAIVKLTNSPAFSSVNATGGTVWVQGGYMTSGADQPYTLASSGAIIAERVSVSSSSATLFGGTGTFSYSKPSLSGGVKLAFTGAPTVIPLGDVEAKTVQVLTASGNTSDHVDYVFMTSTSKITATAPSGLNRLIHPMTFYSLDAPLVGQAHEVAVAGGGTIKGGVTYPVPADASITVIPAVTSNVWRIIAEAGYSSGGSGGAGQCLFFSTPTYTQPGSTAEALFGGNKFVAAEVGGTTRRLYVELRSTNGSNAVRVRLYSFTDDAYVPNLSGGLDYISVTSANPAVYMSDDIAAELVDGQYYEVRAEPQSASTIAFGTYGAIKQ